MQMLLKILLFFICIVLSANSDILFAQYYKYTDDKGVVIFTDDLSKVPASQRTTVKSYQSHQKKEGDKKNISTEKKFNNSDDDLSKKFSKQTDFKLNYKVKKNELEREKEILDEEKTKLSQEKEQITSSEQAKEYNKKVKLFNKKVKLFKETLKEFYSDIKPE